MTYIDTKEKLNVCKNFLHKIVISLKFDIQVLWSRKDSRKIDLGYCNSFRLLKGGAETGFRRVQPEEYKPRLFHVVGERRNVVVKEVTTANL